MGEFHWVGEETIHAGDIIRLTRVTVEAPDGRLLNRDVVHHPGAVAMVPLLGDRQIVLVRQYRTPLQDDLLEIPAGKRDVDGEPLEVTAARELAEECGLAPGRLVKVGEFFNSCGFSDELTHVFLALDLTEVPSEAHGVEEEHLTLERVPLAEVPAMIADGRLRDAKTLVGLLLALRWVDTQP